MIPTRRHSLHSSPLGQHLMLRGCVHVVLRFFYLFLFASTFCASSVKPAYAWKPNTHLYAANQAIKTILAGNDYITIDGVNYPVDHRVAQAIRNQTAYYRGGVVGPDGFPDILVGQ